MKALKIILFSIYPILIALLLLFNQNHAQSTPSSQVDTTNIVREAERVGNQGALKVTLLWDFDGDIDLHVIQPNGTEILYNRRNDSVTGGSLDVDNQKGGSGAAENIYWSNPPKGNYRIRLVYFQESQRNNIAGSGTCNVVVFQEGKTPQTYPVYMSQIKEVKDVSTIQIQ